MLQYNPRVKFIQAVGQSGISFEDHACIAGINVLTLFKFASGEAKLYRNQLETLAAILGKDPGEIFEEGDARE